MSSRLTNISSKKAHKALKRLGFDDKACGDGSHQQMVRERLDDEGVVKRDILTLVLGKREIPPHTLKGALKQGNVTEDEFLDKL